MIYFLLAGFSGIIFSTLIIYFRQRFFTTLEATLGLSNAVLSDEEEAVKQKNLIIALKAMLISLGVIIVLIALIIALTLIPILLYIFFKKLEFSSLDLSSLGFILSFSVGSILPFSVKRKKENEDYSEASILLHKLILNNYFLSKFLFSIDNKFKKGGKIEDKKEFLIVSGLARAGTTSLTDQLFKAGSFSSLDYSNMPMLLAPNLWRKVYNPKRANLKERKHGDKMLFGLNTIEALEEYFFKVFSNDNFITDKYLIKHEITQDIYDKYLKYQALVRQDKNSTYLSKNNNLILRYTSLRNFNQDFKIIFLFRKPEDHAYSLLNQHQRFTEFQQDNDFVQTYMNWLGHHEFGNNQKVFKFTDEEPAMTFDKDTLNYWLEVWLNYYNYLLHVEDNNFMLIDYEDYLKTPKNVLELVGNEIQMSLNFSKIEPFENTRTIDISTCDKDLLNRVNDVYSRLKNQKINF